MAEEGELLQSTLLKLGLRMKFSSLVKTNPPELLREVLHEFFRDHGAFVSMCTQHLPSPLENAPKLVYIQI